MFFCFWRTSALFLEEISPLRILLEFSRVARRTWRKFLEFFSLHSNSLAHSHLPCLRVNPISHRRHPSARKLHAADERGLPPLQENHRWVMLLRGTFFPQVAAQCAFFGRIFFSENLARIFASGSQNLQKIPGNFLAPFVLPRLLTLALPCLLILFHSGDIQVLEKCTQLTKVNFEDCKHITGGCCLEECSFPWMRTSALFGKKFLF